MKSATRFASRHLTVLTCDRSLREHARPSCVGTRRAPSRQPPSAPVLLAYHSPEGGCARWSRYQKLFAQAPSEAMRGIADDPQERYVRAIIATVQEDDAFKPLRGRLPALIAGLGELKTSVATRDELALKKEMALRDVRLALDRAKRVYNLMYPRLQVLFPDDAALVETFFRQLHVPGKAQAEDETEPEQPGTTEEPGGSHPQ